MVVSALAVSVTAGGIPHATTALADTSATAPAITTDATTGVQYVSANLTVTATECAALKATLGTQDCPVSIGLEVEPVGGTATGVEDGATAASSYRVYHEVAVFCFGQLKWGGPSGWRCEVTYIEVNAYYRHWYNSPRTWIQSMSQPCPWATQKGFSITQTWCAWTGNGTNDMTTGANFDWSTPWSSGNAWMRIHNQPCGGWCVKETLVGGSTAH